MDPLLFEARLHQLKNTRQQLWKLVEFTTDAVSTELAFRPSQIASQDGIRELSKQLPAAARNHAEAKCLYYLEADNAVALVAAFEEYAARALAGTNKRTTRHSVSKRYQHSESNCLYVGSSALANLAACFKRHCGYYGGQDRTFGLKLNRWLPADDMTLKLCYWRFDALDQAMLQLLKDGLWEHKKPLFGRQGKA